MNLFVPFLMLAVPGIIAVSVHRGQLIHITRKNWQPLVWIYLLYSLAIVFSVNFVMWLSYPDRTISFSPQTTWTTSNVLSASFVFKYTLFAVSAALVLPKLWQNRQKILRTLRESLKKILAFLKKRKAYKIPDDE